MVSSNEHIVVTDGYALARSCLSKNRNVRITYIQWSIEMNVTAHSESNDTRSFCFNCMTKGTFRPIICKCLSRR